MKLKEIHKNDFIEDDWKLRKLGSRLSCFSTKAEFGLKNEFYIRATKQLVEICEKAKEQDIEVFQQVLKRWKGTYSQIYGDRLSLEIFINHLYLTILIKSILYLKICSGKVNRQEIRGVVTGDFFATQKANLFHFDLSNWLADELVENESTEIFYNAIRILSKYDLTTVEEDIFRGLYEELIERTDRHKVGEYYTPSWLVHLTLEKVFSIWENTIPPKILDPACGSGTFLFYYVKCLIKKFNMSSSQILKHFVGFDINPIAELVTKANLLLALNEPTCEKLPIYVRDALRDEDIFNSYGNMNDFDVLVGNPPWIVLRSIKVKKYQDFIKKEMLKYNLLNNGNIHLHTQMDTATLFFRKCADKYLKTGGIIAFVMPRSVLGCTHQHSNFRKLEYPHTKLVTILDLENVEPLFKMPACVLIGLKGLKNTYPVFMERYWGKLPERNLSLPEVKSHLLIENEYYTPLINEQKASYYYNKFKVGVSIFPRSLYFVDLCSVTDNTILITTAKSILRIVKEPWKNELQGEVEQDFLFCTVLPWEMVPFGFVKMRPVILPLSVSHDTYRLSDIKEIKNEGYLAAYNWFNQAQRIWDENKTVKSNERFPRLIDRLNYNNLLSFQHPNKEYVVLYNATGKDITSCVIRKSKLVSFDVGNSKIYPRSFISDVKTWYLETNSSKEAHYLSAILNSAILSKLIKPYQPRGLFGARAIHRRPLQFPIPKFDEQKQLHLELSLLGKKIHKRVRDIILKDSSKNNVKKRMDLEITYIDDLVQRLLE